MADREEDEGEQERMNGGRHADEDRMILNIPSGDGDSAEEYDDDDDDDDSNSLTSQSFMFFSSSSSSSEEEESSTEEEEDESDETDSFSSLFYFGNSSEEENDDDDDAMSTMSAMTVLIGGERARDMMHHPNNSNNNLGRKQRRHHPYDQVTPISPALNIIHHDDRVLFQEGRVVKRRRITISDDKDEESSSLPAIASIKVIPLSSIKDDDVQTTTGTTIRSNDICFQDLPPLMQLSVLQFLDVQSLIAVRQVDRSLRDLLRSVHSETCAIIWKPACQRQWPWLKDLAEKELLLTNDGDVDGAITTDFARILSLSAKGTPSHSVNEAAFPSFVQFTDSTTRTAIEYTGVVGPGNRCIRANTPLPRPSTKVMGRPLHSKKHLPLYNIFQWHPYVEHWKPFVVPFAYRTAKSYCLEPRLVSYFEVTVLPPPKRNDEDCNSNPINNSHRDCVAIGLAESMNLSLLSARMPGWDERSFGYHGDDGGYFHGAGWSVYRLPVFGNGDCVGCGIDYFKGNLFFCKNGIFLGYIHSLTKLQLQRDWYPVVGLDSRCPVQVNFGLTPFQFDLEVLMKDQSEAVATALRR